MTRRILAVLLARGTARFDVSLVALGCAVGCSLLTKPEQGEPHCEITEDNIDPCPEGMYCVDKSCRPEGACAEREECGDRKDNDCDDKVDEENPEISEICDTKDNDCDGETDEEFDVDKDGWSICGTANFENGTYDCEPNIKEVHPNAPEVCDGLDNDCDGERDEDSDGTMCSKAEKCIHGSCVVPSCAVPNSGVSCKTNETCVEAKCLLQACSPACKANEYCDMPSLTCMAQPPKKSGEGCVVDSDCDQTTVKLMCLDRAALRLPAGDTRGVCGIGCCSDSDCGTNESCFVSGTGARSCLPKTLTINPPAPPRCTSNESCAPTNQTCAAGLLGTGSLATTICRTPTANTANEHKIGESCATSSNCASKLCVDGNIFQQLCSAPCRDSSDCKPLEEPVNRGFTSATPYCQYVKLSDYDPKLGDNFAPICLVARGQEVGSGRNGAECIANRDCASGVCLGASAEGKGRCAQTCCSDAQCAQGAPGAPPTRCQPVLRGTGRFEMRCLVR